MNKINKYLQAGLLFNVIFLMSNQLSNFPELLKGFFAGLAIALMLFGAYATNHDVSKLEGFKKGMFNKVFSK